MKKQFYIYGLFAAALTLGACDYNEDNFPGFDELAQPKHVWNDTLTLGSNDYKTIAEMAANKELALSKDPEGKSFADALSAVASNKFFTEDAPALWYLPAFIADKYPYMDDKSKVTVHYDEFANLPAYVTRLAGVKNYTFDSNDYKVVWGEEQRVSFVSPSTKSKISDALAAGISKPKDGDIVAVNYAWSDTEPSFGEGGSQEPEVTYTPIGQITDAGDYTAKGEVIATYGRGFLLGDETGAVLVYLNAPVNYSIGDVVTVAGTTSKYNGLLQFPAASKVERVERSKEFAYPSAQAMSGAELDAYMAKPSVKYAKVTGKLSISGTYYNLEVAGCTRQGSVSYPVEGLIDSALNGQNVTVEGYLIGGTKKFVNIMATSVVAAGAKAEFTPVGVVALSKEGDYKVKGSVVALYKRGFLLNDGTGSILVYLNKESANKIGDVVAVSGKTSAFAGFMQFGADAVVTTVKEAAADFKYKYPAVAVMQPADLDAYVAAPFIGYVQYTGKLKIDGYYMNVIIEGAEKAQGSLSYVLDGQVDKALDGKNITVTGYVIGVSGGKFVNTMVLKVEEATAAAAFAMTRAAVTPNASALYAYDGEAKVWKQYREEGVDVSILQPSDYTMFGSNYVGKPADMLPLYLTKNYPFAKIDDVVAVVYANNKDDKDKLGASEFKFDGSAWIMTTKAAPSVITFQKSEGAWVEARVYLDASFKDNDGEFKVYNKELPQGSTYVWKYNSSYSNWRASAYVNGGNKESESYLVSPEFELTKAINPVVVFDCAIQYLNDGELSKLLNLEVSDDYIESDPSKATWKVLKVNQWPAGNSKDFVTVESESLAAYAGKKIRIAFHYKSTTESAPTVDIKNLVVKE